MARATPLGFDVVSCAMSGELEPVRQAILTKYHINSRDASSQGTALHAVASALALDQNIKDGHIEIVKWLLENGIDYSIRDESGKTAEDRLFDAKQHREAAKALDIIKKWKERNSLADQEARRRNLHRDAKKEKQDIIESERLLRIAKILKVTVVSASGLPAKDSNGLSDPYAKLRYGALHPKEKKLHVHDSNAHVHQAPSAAGGHVDQQHHHHKQHKHKIDRQKRVTKTIHKTLSPVWNETFEFETNLHKDNPKSGPPPHLNEDSLRIEVWDKDDVRDDFIGYVQTDLTEIAALIAHNEREHRFVLLPDKAAGITLRFEIL